MKQSTVAFVMQSIAFLFLVLLKFNDSEKIEIMVATSSVLFFYGVGIICRAIENLKGEEK